MTSKANSPEEYVQELPEERKAIIQKLRKIILDNLPDGFEETMSYGMIGYVIPHSVYPKGHHCTPKLPLPFINIASQKNFVALYHMGIYADKNLLNWFTSAYKKISGRKLDIGKNCIRFKKTEAIPYNLIAELVSKITPQDWIQTYEETIKKKDK
ncbi:DUF1801 domain-containing protein [Gillisia limnaea]|uniref:YdhG-like domain-containing protein n=1 Tax=Gillisia limnaea (strain DSM 15749 / LMG 21470 / R-8282) TaxID=865937 RepID=H2BTA7_GILLR|nr:DUF1801 domain-containing protein [Gillisia limnaea]EHQ03706.1 protein of unknown function DUF1801 [Gillisia limnaea DSM 15749]